MVTASPTTSEITMIGPVRPVPSSSGMPMDSSSLASPARSPAPAATPRAEPTTPMTIAWRNTMPNTDPGEAPTARSSANSLTRWRTLIAKEFMMMKDPTNMAMTTKTSRKTWMKPSCSSMVLFCSLMSSARVFTWAPSGTTLVTSDLTVSTEAPSARSIEMFETLPSGAAMGMNHSGSIPTTVALAMEDPKWNSPTTLTSVGSPWMTICVVSPTLRPEFFKAPDSRAISPPPWGM